MADIVNLRQARKQKLRSVREAEASANRALHGRTKAEKLRDAADADRTARLIDGHFRQNRKPGIDK